MYQVKEYTHPRINKAVDYLYSQVYLVTQCKQMATSDGNHELAEKFAQAEAMARMAVEELRLLDVEMIAPPVPQGQSESACNGESSPLMGDV